MKLAVCGCSWSSRDPSYPDTEFGYFVSKDLGWDYKNYGRVGCDNFSIRLQVDQAIKENADFVIINWTTACRFSWNHSGKAYDPKKGIKHLDYDVDQYMTNESSHPTYPDNDPVIISQSLTGMINTQDIDMSYEELCGWWDNLETSMSKKQYEVFREYFIHMYDDDLEAHKQYYIMQSAVKALQDAHIPFIFAPNTFGFKQTMMEYKGLSDDEAQRMYKNWDFIPKDMFEPRGIADALQWDFEVMEDPINYPTHNHLHHLSAWAQEKWANDIALPRIKKILEI